MGNPHGGNAARRSEEQTRETRKERVDRELLELLNELRVALPGVQILFAFLLTVPFSVRFGDLTLFQRDVYYVTLIGTVLSTAGFIAPTPGRMIRLALATAAGSSDTVGVSPSSSSALSTERMLPAP